MKKLGLISGKGSLPKAIASEARSKGYSVTAIGLDPLADRDLSSFVDEVHWINVGKLGGIIAALRKSGITEAVMAGKVPKSLLYKSRITPDLRAAKLLFTLKDRSDDSILLAIAKELEKEGITLLKTIDFSTQLLTPAGILTAQGLSDDEWKDVAFGWKIAKEIGRLDIGQTVVIKHQAVMAVEAIEGTDEAILRGGTLAGKGAVVIKVSKPHQDMRFDVPVVGMETLSSMISVSARVLAVEAQNSILMDRARMIEESEKAGISVLGYSERQ